MQDAELIAGRHGRLAICQTPGSGPTVIFLGGFRSDMSGTKAMDLQAWAEARGQAFIRFDYSGHGMSEGRFEEGAIGDWLEDARAVVATAVGPVVLVGSSMGGWIGCLLARDMPDRVAGLVTIAAAPDFTEHGFVASMTPAEHEALQRDGQIIRPSEYGTPLVITRRLIEEGRQHLVFDRPLPLPMPVRMLQGTDDLDVPEAWAHRLLAHASGHDITLTLVKGADHRFSEAPNLALIRTTLDRLLEQL